MRKIRWGLGDKEKAFAVRFLAESAKGTRKGCRSHSFLHSTKFEPQMKE